MSTHENFPTEELLAQTPHIQSLAAHLAKDWERDDLVQEAWLKALRQPPKHRRNLRSWFAGVLRHRATDRGRREAAQERRVEKLAPADDPATPPELLERAEAHRAVVAALQDLDEPYRHVLLLHYFDGLTLAQIGERLGMPKATVGSRLHRGASRLRQLMIARHGRDAFTLCVGAAGPLAAGLMPGAATAAQVASSAGGTTTAPSASPFSPVLVASIGLFVLAVATAFLLPNLADHLEADPAPVTAMASGSPAPLVERSADTRADTAPQRTEETESGNQPLVDPGDQVVVCGRCIEAETGAPIAGLDVELEARASNGTDEALYGIEGWQPPPPTTTDADGRFEVRYQANRAKQFHISIEPAGRTPRTARWSWHDGPRAGDVLDLGEIAFLAGHTVGGQVVDQAGQPLAGIQVSLHDLPLPVRPDMAANDTRSGVSGTDGRFTIQVPIPPGIWPVRVSDRNGYALWESRIVEVGPAGQTSPLVLSLEAIPLITGHVVDPDGKPIHKVYLRAEDPHTESNKGLSSWTRESDGFFRIRKRYPEAGPVRITIDQGTTAPWESEGLIPWDTHGLTIVVERAPSLAILVREADGGAPVENYAVVTNPIDPRPRRASGARLGGNHAGGALTVEPAPTGIFELCVIPERRDLRPSEWIDVQNARTAQQPVEIELRSMPVTAVQVLDADGAPVEGSTVEVVVALGQDLSPNWTVQPTPASSARVRSGHELWLADVTTTDAQGRADVHWPDGKTLALRVRGEHGPAVVQPWDPASQTVHVVKLEFEAPVEVALTRATGWPAAGVDVRPTGIRPHTSDPRIRSAAFDASLLAGPMKVPPGQYEVFLRVHHESRDPRGISFGGDVPLAPPIARFSVSDGAPLHLSVDPSPYEPAVLHGVVNINGGPADGGHIWFMTEADEGSDPPEGPHLDGIQIRLGAFAVDDHGNYRAEGLPPVRMQAHYQPELPEGIPTFFAELGAPVDLAAGETRRLDLAHAMQGLRLRILAADGNPAPRTPLRLATANGDSSKAATDEQGRLELDGVPAAGLTVWAVEAEQSLGKATPAPGRRWTEITLRLPGGD